MSNNEFKKDDLKDGFNTLENSEEIKQEEPDLKNKSDEQSIDALNTEEHFDNQEFNSIKTHSFNSKILSIKKLILTVSLILLLTISIYFNLVSFFNGNSELSSSNLSFVFLFFCLFITTSGSLVIVYWMYYVKTLYLKDGPALVPEKWGRYIYELSNIITKSDASINNSMEFISKNTQKQYEINESLMKSFLTLQSAIDLRDKEIERLRNGYDTKIYKRFLNKFIKLSQSINEIQDESKGTEQEKNYKFLSRSISVALEDCGVETFIPEINSDYREAGPEVADNPVEIISKDINNDFLIASVESPGYVIDTDAGKQVITQAKVVIYKYCDTKSITK